MKHSRQGVAIGAAAALGLAMLGATPAVASGDADLVDLHIIAPGNGVMAGILEQDFGLVLEWDADVDTSTFDKLTWSVLSVVDQNGNQFEFDAEASYAYYDEDFDDVYYTTDSVEDISAPNYTRVTWAGEGSDDSTSDGGFVGPYKFDATTLEHLNANSTYYSDFFGQYFLNPWIRLGVGDDAMKLWESNQDVSKLTYRIQAFVDSNLNGQADSNEVRSGVATFTQLNEHRFTGVVSQSDVPGWFRVFLSPTVFLNQKLTNFNWNMDNGMDAEIAEESYYLYLDQVGADGKGGSEMWWMGASVSEDGLGWGIAEDGTVTYSNDLLRYWNAGTKVNRVWVYSEPGMEPGTRVSNLETFGYVAASKIVKRSNTTAKMYAFDILGAGKVEFRHNGRVIARIDMVDEGDPRARANGNRPYFVRTVNFVRGKNTLEVVVNGKVLKKHTYTLRAGMV